MPRMNILSTGEKDEFDTPPIFNSAQRKQFFGTPPDLMQEVNKLRTPANKIAFIMSHGYFKAGKRFFAIESYHDKDVEYVSRKMGFDESTFDADDYPARTRRNHQKIILEYCGFKPFDKGNEDFIYQEIRSMVLSNLKPKLIFWRCVDLMIREKIQIPGYNRISEMILKVLQFRKEELTAIARSALTPDVEALLNELFVQTETDHGQSQNSPYKLTTLKKLSQSSKPAKVNERVSDFMFLENLHQKFVLQLV